MNISQRVFLLLGIFVSLLGSMLFASAPDRVLAACAGVSNLGTVEYDMLADSLPSRGSLWLRLLPDSNGESLLKLELANGDCVDVRLDQVSSEEWIWRNVYEFSDFSISDNNEVSKLRVIGVYGNVKLEKILITSKDCIPYADGTNCLASSSRVDEDGVSYSLLPARKGDISGRVVLTDLSTDSQEITESRYMVDGRIIQRNKGFEAFDSTLVANGAHRVYMIFEGRNSGDTIREAVDVVVANAENPFSSIIRHAKQNREVYVVGLSGVISVILIFVMLRFARQKRVRGRQRKAKGLDF